MSWVLDMLVKCWELFLCAHVTRELRPELRLNNWTAAAPQTRQTGVPGKRNERPVKRREAKEEDPRCKKRALGVDLSRCRYYTRLPQKIQEEGQIILRPSCCCCWCCGGIRDSYVGNPSVKQLPIRKWSEILQTGTLPDRTMWSSVRLHDLVGCHLI